MLWIQGAIAKIASMKCPACGMATPDAQDWCDFCKEPFRKKKSAAAKAAVQPQAQPAQKSPPPAAEAEKSAPEKKVVITSELLAKLQCHQTQSKRAAAPQGALPPEFAHLDSGERIQQLPPSVRKMAWVFLAIVFIWIVVFTVIILRRGDPNTGSHKGSDGGAKVHIVR